MLVAELLPRRRQQLRISPDPSDVALSGSSFGRLCAGWTALHHPETFGNAILQSPSVWYHPRVHRDEPGMLQRRELVTPTLIADYAATARRPARMFHESGHLEDGPPAAQLRRAYGHRRLHDVLTLQGLDTTYREFAGGHDAAWWRGTFADALEWTFPPTRTNPAVNGTHSDSS